MINIVTKAVNVLIYLSIVWVFRFQKAARNRDLLVFSPPYVDFGGAGDIVTISQAVALNGTDSSEAPWVHSVLALDMNVRSLYYLMA